MQLAKPTRYGYGSVFVCDT